MDVMIVIQERLKSFLDPVGRTDLLSFHFYIQPNLMTQILSLQLRQIRSQMSKRLACKIFITILSLSTLVHRHTQLDIMGSSIGITGIAMLILLNSGNGLNLSLSFLKTAESRHLKCLISILAVLTLDLPWPHLIVAGIWTWYIFPFISYLKKKKLNQSETASWLLSNILILQCQLIQLKNEKAILWSWKVLSLGFALLAILIGVILVVVGWPLLKNQQFHFAFLDDDNDDSEQSNVHQGRVNVIFAIDAYLTYLGLFGHIYLGEYIQENIVLAAFIGNLMECLIYSLFSKEIARYMNCDLFSRSVRKRNGWNIFADKPSNIKKKGNYGSLPACLTCDRRQTAQFLHQSCGRLIFCLSCFQSLLRLPKTSKSKLKCPICSSKTSNMLKLVPSVQIDQHIRYFLQPGDHLFVDI